MIAVFELDDQPRKVSVSEMEKPMNKVNLPQTDSIQELAAYWDTHDLIDHEDELEKVAEPVFESPTIVPVPLDSEQVATVEKSGNNTTDK